MTDTGKTCTIHEHLHNQLKQLIAVDHPTGNGVKVSQNGSKHPLDPKSLLKLSRNDERQQNKVQVVTRLLNALREDQSGVPKATDADKQTESDEGLTGRIHGCVGSHWELLPPVYPEASEENDNDQLDNSSEMLEDFRRDEDEPTEMKKFDKRPPGRRKSEFASSWLWPVSTNTEEILKDGGGDNTTKDETPPPKKERIYPVIRGGGLRLPGLDWNKTFRKGYTVLVWVRPSLNCVQTTIPEDAAVRKQVLYRFASSLHDNVGGAVGVCAILGQWKAVTCPNSSGDNNRTLLTSTVTAYTLPNSDPMSHLYPSTKATQQPTTVEGASGDSKEENAHTRNLEHFREKFRQEQGSSFNRRFRNKASSSMSGEKSPCKDSAAAPISTGGYVTAQLTLPADEWCLIGIQHTHPYLRRPELIISVNGEEIVKGELAYPVLDAVVHLEDDISSGVSSMAISGTSSTSPKGEKNDVALGANASFLTDSERKMLKKRGVLAECTVLDGAFENGVLDDTKPVDNRHDDNREKLNCVLSVHSLALLAGMVPNVVLAMIAERGPMGDSASGSGLSFLLGPVPTNPQNRDAIVALLAGYGYYGNGGGGSSGIAQGSGYLDKLALPPRTVGLPLSIGIMPGPTMRKGSRSRDSSAGSDDSQVALETWIGSEKEHDAHIILQGLLGRPILTYHAGDTRFLGHADENNTITTSQGRIICQPSTAPACIGGADEVPKVGIVRPTTPVPVSKSARLEVTGNACYHNVTSSYIRNENLRQQINITPSADENSKHDDRPPVSFTRAIHASNAVSGLILPFRLALPRTGGEEEVNPAQQKIISESLVHLNDLLSNQAQLAALLIELLNECILCAGSTLKDDALQNGSIHALTNLLRRVLIRGARLGLLATEGRTNKFNSIENIDYDKDHESSCPPIIPAAICKALVHLIDVCCGPVSLDVNSFDSHPIVISDPFCGLLRIRRTTDLALTAFFGLALDFDLLGKDLLASASILEAISQRYCQISNMLLNSKDTPHGEPLYGSLLRSQMNIQYFLDSIRVRLDNAVSLSSKQADKSDQERNALESIANSLSDILYSMLLSSLTSASGSAVTRGERDIGALVATLTECHFGSICARVVTSSIAKLLIKCGVFSPLLLERSSQQLKESHRRRDTLDLALENRLARNMLLSRFHDIVGPLILSKSAPTHSTDSSHSREEKEDNKETRLMLSCRVGVVSENHVLDWTYDWRLSLLTFSWLSSLAGSDERLTTSRAAGDLILEAAKSCSLDGAFGNVPQPTSNGTEKSNAVKAVSHFLVLRSSVEKDVSVSINKAETTSRRLSVFMHLVPGITRLILSPSIKQTGQRSNNDIEAFTVSHEETASAAELLKEILTMLSVSIQSLYGSKKGGLLTMKPGSNETVQRNRAKTLFVDAAKEYSPIMLQVVSMLEIPIEACKKESNSSKNNDSSNETPLDDTDTHSDTVHRKRTDSTDKDWVDVHHSSETGDVTSSISSCPSKSSMTKKVSMGELPPPGRKCYNDLASCQDIALYAVSRLVAQAMKYGGGESSTAVWRTIIRSLSIDAKEGNESSPNESKDDGKSGARMQWSTMTLCHLVALVLSKFARYHDKGEKITHSQWNPETCAAVARLMDLVEEKQLLSSDSKKFSIDQVRLIKSVLEIMKSGREHSGWLQLDISHHLTSQPDDSITENVGKVIDDASTQSHYLLYNQQPPVQSISIRNPNSNPKLLLPILQSCLRLMLPSMGIIRSEAVVISAASTGKAPSTSVLLQLISSELDASLTCAISGLVFSVSRDIFMSATTTLQKALKYHNSVNDSKAVRLCSDLILSIIEAMRRRYVNERSRKDKASSDSYDDGEGSAASQGEVVERIILGQNQVPINDSNDLDFIAFSGDANASPNMGFMQYKGLGSALNRCFRELNEKPSLGTRCLGLSGFKTPEDKAQLALSILAPYLDNWNKAMAHDDEEQELVDLFDESQARTSSTHEAQLSSLDAMTRFAEAQAMLKQQHYHLAFEYFVSRRFGRSAFTERLCWKTWMEFVGIELSNQLWERGVYDGGRDYYSKLATMPMFPQFARFIPSYLDHSPSSLDVPAPTPEIDLKGQGITIVDITKKEIDEEALDQDFENDDGVEEPKDFQEEEDLDVLFPKRQTSQLSSSAHFGSVGDASVDGDGVEEPVVFFPKHNDSQLSSSIHFESTGDASINSEEDKRLDESNKEEQEADSPNTHNEESLNLVEPGNFHFASSSFSFPPDSTSLLSMGEGVRLAGGMMEEYYSSCLCVKPDCSRKCIVILTENHLIIEFEDGDGIVEGGEYESHKKKLRDSLLDDKAVQNHDQKILMDKALRPKAMRWNISEASHIYLRRYRLRDSALEIFFIPSAGATTGGTAFFSGSRSLFIDFGAGAWGNTRRDDAANALMKRAPMQTVKQWPDKSGVFLHDELKKLTQAWSQGAISNFDYLCSLNCLSGRSYNDICQYPVFPWTLCNFSSETVPDLTDKANYRDLSKPIGALNEQRLNELIDRFETFADPSIPPFMYGSHYSTSAGVVLHFLLRLHPFSTLHRNLQSGHFDVADRLFSSVERTWEMCTGRSAAEVKELTPEFYCNPAFLRNTNELKLGTMQEGEVVGDVVLPPWAKGSAEKFVEVMRMALESDICSEMLGSWIDLIFGYKQQGKHAIEANNVFFYLTYYGSVDVASIEDEGLRLATECQIAHFGQCPMQLFYRPHIKKRDRKNRHSRQTLSGALGLYDFSEENKTLPFMGSPMSYWVHLAPPPPGPHAPLISIRLTISDRCLAVDSKGVYHFFRWAWKPEVDEEEDSDDGDKSVDEASPYDAYRDKGCFVAQRELMSFRNIPCLPYTPVSCKEPRPVTVCMSKTLFSNRTLLLVLSDGDGRGGLGMQLVDPVKGAIKGEVIVPSAHSDYITAIEMDSIGTAAGQGGVGGELAVVGSADGSMTMWRFISSHYWPLRPRLRMTGHSGSKVHAVAISSSLGICVSTSSHKICLFDVGNGAMIRSFAPPSAACKEHLGYNLLDKTATQITTFANTPALCLSTLGYVAVVCSTKLIGGAGTLLDEVFSVELMTLEGVHVGSKLLEPDRGLPKRLFPTVDGRALFICAGRGVSVCLVSSLQPLSFVDEWRLTEEDDEDFNNLSHQAIHDIDFGPTMSRPVVVASGCSDGSLRLHALQGISKWSHENQRSVVTSAVGSVLALPAQTVKNAIGGVAGFGSRFVGLGKEIGKEAFTVVKEREGPFFFRKK